MTWQAALNTFETLYMASRNLATRTRIEYHNDLKQLADFFEGQGTRQPSVIDLRQLQSYLAHLDTKAYAGVSRRRKVSSLKAFFGFLVRLRLIPYNPSEQLIPPEREYKEPRFLTTQEYRALLLACAHETRDAALIELILQTGIRLSEVVKLTLYDIELPPRISREPGNTGSLSVHGKGRKQRRVPLNYKACRALKAWLSVRPNIPEPNLFVTKFRQPMGARAIQNIVAKYVKEAGIRHASTHTLRHSFRPTM